eukprot:318608-Pleurochrysis_carterae.AAC.2
MASARARQSAEEHVRWKGRQRPFAAWCMGDGQCVMRLLKNLRGLRRVYGQRLRGQRGLHPNARLSAQAVRP